MLQTQVAYWQNQEMKRHNQAIEALQGRELGIKTMDSQTNRMNAETNRLNYELGTINALTAQTEAATRQASQKTAEEQLQLNVQKVNQDYDLGLRNVGVAQQNADSARINALAQDVYSRAKANESIVTTQYIPYNTGANLAGSVVNTVSKAIPGVKSAAKGIATSIKNAVYNLRP